MQGSVFVAQKNIPVALAASRAIVVGSSVESQTPTCLHAFGLFGFKTNTNLDARVYHTLDTTHGKPMEGFPPDSIIVLDSATNFYARH